MKVKLPSIVMVFVALALVLSSVAVAPIAVSADPGANSFSRMALPNINNYQTFPDSDIWDITAADDGTVFAIVEDTSVDPAKVAAGAPANQDGYRWGSARYSDYRVFKSTDGGYTWSRMWAIPAAEPTQPHAAGLPVEIVPQPGYNDTDTANQVVFLATDDNLYRSTNGGQAFTRINPECPGVVDPNVATTRDLITSLDVAENINNPGTYLAVVGTGTILAGGEGVFTWNEDNLLSWRDKRAGNTVYGTGYEALDVMFSPNYTDDGVIIAILNDFAVNNDVIMSFYVSSDGLWNGPTLSDGIYGIGTVPSPVPGLPAAGMDVADDFHYLSNPWVFSFINVAVITGDIYAVKALPPLTGPSLVMVRGAAAYARFSDIQFDGTASAGTCYVGSESFNNVIEGKSLVLWPTWTPSIKSPAGCWPIWLADTGEVVLAATMTEGAASPTTSGVSKQIVASTGSVYNGIGLLDDLAETTDLPMGTFYVTMAYVEASPNYANDDTLFVATSSGWYQALLTNPLGFTLSLWRQAPTGPNGAVVWERLLQEGITRFGLPPTGKLAIANPGIFTGAPTPLPALTWVPKVDPAFQYSNFIFLLASLGPAERIWFSADRGDTWHPVSQMPPVTTAVALSEIGWCVVDNSTLLVGDSDGWVYKTTNRGNSWSDGAFTDIGVVTDLNISPAYSTDNTIVAGVAYHGTPSAPLGTLQIVNEVWISLDGAETDFTIVGSELMWDPVYGGIRDGILGCTANFDADWENNRVVYGAASGAMDNWVLNPISGVAELQDTSEVGIWRAEVNLVDTQASTWVPLYGADDFIAEAATPVDDCVRYVYLTDLSIGADGTIYVPFYLYHDDSMGTITPGSIMRYTLGGMVRCLDGTAATADLVKVSGVLGPFDGLWLMSVVPGSNHLFSAAWDVVDWRFKLAHYEDMLSGAGPAAGADAPADGATAVGAIAGNTVSVPLSWADTGATTYELQVSTDSAFTSPTTITTSDTSATASGLEQGVTYYWRVRAKEPTVGNWSAARSFTTVTSSELLGPQLLSPEPGAYSVSSDTAFMWSLVDWATDYELKVWTDAGTVVGPVTVQGQTYAPAEPLDTDTTHYWYVIAKKGSNEVSSGDAFFSTATAVGAKQPTPAWVWAVIAISAVLLIAVLVLIIRTRRPA